MPDYWAPQNLDFPEAPITLHWEIANKDIRACHPRIHYPQQEFHDLENPVSEWKANILPADVSHFQVTMTNDTAGLNSSSLQRFIPRLPNKN